jgi:KDO2-lipid IV(A) lauroyltransferase
VNYKLQLYLMKGIYALLRCLPLSFSTSLSRAFGYLLPLLPARKRVLNNLRITGFEPAISRKKFLRQVGAHSTQLFLDYAHINTYEKCPDMWPLLQGDAVLKNVVESKKGAVFVTAHFGYWEAIRLASRARGVEIGIIYRPFNNPFVDEYAFELASQAGQPVFRKSYQGLREMVKHIRSGGFVLILVDQRSGGAPQLDFMGQPAETSLAAAEIAEKFNVPLIPCYAKRADDMQSFSVYIEDPIDSASPEIMMQSVNYRIESWVKNAPEQWFWLHNRWKKR